MQNNNTFQKDNFDKIHQQMQICEYNGILMSILTAATRLMICAFTPMQNEKIGVDEGGKEVEGKGGREGKRDKEREKRENIRRERERERERHLYLGSRRRCCQKFLRLIGRGQLMKRISNLSVDLNQ